MIKIDFHIHTVPSTLKNESFVFSLRRLQEYVSLRRLDAIAVTNHNLFDETNFLAIKNGLSITVFPGIEVDLENGHILVITDNSNISEFKGIASIIALETSTGCSLSIERFLSLFEDRNKYLF